MSVYSLDQCIKCHSEFQNSKVIKQKQLSMIQRVRSNQMPPGSTLTEEQKKQLIRQITVAAKSK